ncbi:hypothetical protein [Halovivax gelatinilyticus]|uniref:hypothetical protein n=1 Tax=Halovivax gelatinilyticus TaxID=2961597 RepID=UPI0020CA61D7|nr:hypothetical protein [Halovivax gelatinilyticus]
MAGDDSGRSVRRVGPILLSATLILTPTALQVAGLLDQTATLLATVAILAIASGIGLTRRDRHPSDDESENEGTVWDAIASWQYDGRHVESGGLTRGEQEKAVSEIHAQADAIEAETTQLDGDPPDETQ